MHRYIIGLVIHIVDMLFLSGIIRRHPNHGCSFVRFITFVFPVQYKPICLFWCHIQEISAKSHVTIFLPSVFSGSFVAIGLAMSSLIHSELFGYDRGLTSFFCMLIHSYCQHRFKEITLSSVVLVTVLKTAGSHP